MPSVWVIAASLLLQPILDEATPLRLVASGTGEEPITWVLDGHTVATTRDGVPVTINASAGEHELWAVTQHEGAWRALARPDPHVTTGAAYVSGWYAEHEAAALAPGPGATQVWPWLLGAAGLVLLATPWRWRRPKGP